MKQTLMEIHDSSVLGGVKLNIKLNTQFSFFPVTACIQGKYLF